MICLSVHVVSTFYYFSLGYMLLREHELREGEKEKGYLIMHFSIKPMTDYNSSYFSPSMIARYSKQLFTEVEVNILG